MRWIEGKIWANSWIQIDRHATLPEEGAEVLVQVRKARNIKHHRLYWALLHATVEATNIWAEAEELHRWLKISLGHYTPHVQPNGTVLCELLPTNFAAMDQTAFGDYYSRALATIAMETGIDAEALIEETWE